jgi:hypothetical protein
MIFVISVSKTYKHRGRNITHKPKTKKHWQIMYYDIDEDTEEWKLYSKFVNPLQAFYYKFHKYYKRQFYCEECENVFDMLVKKRQKTSECPNCNPDYEI